jgi:hypothetical protein
MTTGGWINLILSVGFVTTLYTWCIYRVLRSPKDPAKLAHIEPLDEQEAEER